jgi:hypothetical protein
MASRARSIRLFSSSTDPATGQAWPIAPVTRGSCGYDHDGPVDGRVLSSGARGGSFQWATRNGSAVAPGDYTAQALTTVAFAADTTSKTLAVAVKGDSTRENNETFTVVVSGMVGATAPDAVASVTVRDDD